MSLYWAVLYHVEDNLSSLVVFVVDFDGQVAPYTDITPVVGPMIVETAQSLLAPSGTVGWQNEPASVFNYDPMAVRQAIYDEKAWAAIIINPNATVLLQAAVNNGNASYDPMGAAQVIYVEARDETTLDTYVVPQLQQFQTQATASFGREWASQVLSLVSSNSSVLTNIRTSPQALSPAIGFSTFNLRPFLPPTATPAITIGLIYLIIIAFFSFTFYLPIHSKFLQPQDHPPLKFCQMILWRWIATITAYFFLSLSYSLISLAFQIPFSAPPAPHTEVVNPTTAYHYGSFPVYWMINFVGMIALGLACENVAMVVGQPWMAFWLIFWVISNVSTAFYSITLALRFYFWGYAWPLHNIVNASRTILFDVRSRIGLNFGILFAWCAVNTALFPLCCYFMRWKTMREKKKEEQQKKE
ncbi:MNNG and nitrosoguanidine resistance protein-like protein [Hyaloscypha variabilis F]|uniref:MNNG and nitrosoguanidine resistance protein-like protein n=1 Tax=Hyaloscypha variabilis (strain UAMH 11265 / GT02V1 / F) TaxID=1149755 RepID=A0A2J6RCA7_HYAVF|nr:MNNG and nitrosoguanidine resistance protein-like protein [Hyaloscypha variabilis F]